MKCPKCQTENRDGIKFCEDCGNKLEIKCPSCGVLISLGKKFCGECGHNLQEPKEPPDYSEPQSYTPRFLADKILTSRSSIEGERKLVTVFFADVANFTTLSEKLDPEEVHQIMDGCFKILMDEIHGYEGTINQFTGDGVMALFGAPLAHEDHAQRACHAALAIQKAMQPYGEKIKKDSGADFSMRIGLNSGHVIVGSIGDNLRMDYTAVGDTTNLAARMEGLAKPGSIMISENTCKLVREYFELNDLGECQIKGKDAPQKVYELKKVSSIETRLDASAAKGLTRFVGRENSMRSLKELLTKVQSGSGQVVSVVGEAGVGKSRLALEFRHMFSDIDHQYFEGRCLHFGGSMSYLPFLDIVKSYFDIHDDDREFIIKKKIQDKILSFDQKLTKAIPAFYDLLSLKNDDDVYIKLDPHSKRERTFEAIRDIFLFESQRKPLILVIEDLHWIDKTSEDVINYLVDWIASSQIMLFLLYRPEYTHQWGSKSYYTKIGLDQLGLESSGKLIEAILNGDVVPELRELILNRAAGNPLFMEELTHSLLENGSIKQENNKFVLSDANKDIQVPETIQGIISARMDRLEDNLKRTMQVASVIGRDFAFRILNTITGMRENLKSYLLNLQGLEFIYEKRLFPELEYIFKHALIQEVAYNSLLQNRRKEIHEKIGDAIETIYADRIEEFYGMLVYHYVKSENFEKSIEYSKRAGRIAQNRNAYMDAIYYAKKSVYCLERLPQTDEIQKKRIDARTTLSNYYLNLNFHAEAMEAISPIINLTVKIGYEKRLPRIFAVTGIYRYTIEEDYPKGIEELKKATEFSEKTGDFFSLWFASYHLGTALSFECDFENSLYNFKKACDLSAAASNTTGISLAKITLAVWNYAFNDKINLAFETTKETLHLAEESNDIFLKGVNYSCYGFACYFKGLLDEAEINLLKGVNLCEKIFSFVWTSLDGFTLGNIYYERGDYERARNYFEKSILFLEKGKNCPSWTRAIKIYVAKTTFKQTYSNTDLKTLYKYAYENRMKCFDGWTSRFLCKLLMCMDDEHKSEAEHWIKRALELDGKRDLKWNLAMDHAVYSDLFKKNGDFIKAKGNLSKAIDIFKECGADGWAEKYEKELLKLTK